MIKFNIPLITGQEAANIKEVIESHFLCGDGSFTKKCNSLLQNASNSIKVLLTTSCTHAIEMAALLIDCKPGDEIIMPSYTFVSTANPFALRGAKIVFVDIRPDTMNIDETKIEAAISAKTKAIVPVHYGGVACEMDTIMSIAKKYNLIVIEDAAQGIDATYNGKALGTIGQLGVISFHETKNIQCGEGGAIFINDEKYIERAEIIREKGTDRSKFLRGQIDKYSWVDIGSSYLPSELNAAFLFAQLINRHQVTKRRLEIWHKYYDGLKSLTERNRIELPHIPDSCQHNAHLFYIKLRDIEQRQQMITHLRTNNIQAVFHYIPLHSAPYGSKIGTFNGIDAYTTNESERILRLPMFYDLTDNQVDNIIYQIHSFFS